jgi:hypothetical protein
MILQNIHTTAAWWKEFLTHPATKEALSLVKKELHRLLRHILPTRISGEITFGSEDPAITGRVLAVLGMSFPFHKNCISVQPVFENENILQGNVWLKGRIYGIVLIKIALEVYFNKNVKNVIHRWKLKEG